MAFRALGMIVASVVNSMQESQIVIQMLYLPMLFLSGATFPMDAMPVWLQSVAQFLPASHLYNGMQGILIKNETIAANWMAFIATGCEYRGKGEYCASMVEPRGLSFHAVYRC